MNALDTVMPLEEMRGVIIAKCGYQEAAKDVIRPTDAEIALAYRQADISFQAGREYEKAHPEGH